MSWVGLLINLFDFNYGLGLNVWFFIIVNVSKIGNGNYDVILDLSLDVS